MLHSMASDHGLKMHYMSVCMQKVTNIYNQQLLYIITFSAVNCPTEDQQTTPVVFYKTMWGNSVYGILVTILSLVRTTG